MQFKKLLLPGVLLPVLLSQSAFAANIWVATNGDDARTTSTQALPFKTLAKAALVVKPGDVVNIAAGSYAPVTLTVSGTKPIDTAITATGGVNLVSTNAASGLDATKTIGPIEWKPVTTNGVNDVVQIVGDSSGAPAINVQASYQIINGLIVRGNTDTATLAQVQAYYTANPAGNVYNGGGIVLDNTNAITPVHGLWVKNSIIRNFGCNGIEVIGSDYTVIDRNQVYDNAWYSSKQCSGISVSVASRTASEPLTLAPVTGFYRTLVIGNKIWNNRVLVANATVTRSTPAGSGLVLGPVTADYNGRIVAFTNVIANNGGSAVALSQARRTEVAYNTTYKNGDLNGAAELSVINSNDVNIKSNIFYARDGGKVNVASSNVLTDFNYNITYNGSVQLKGDADNVLDPQLNNPQLDPRLADFRLKATSPAIDNAFGGNAGNTRLRSDLLNLPSANNWGYDGDAVTFRTFNGFGIDRGAYEFNCQSLPLAFNNGSSVSVGVSGLSESGGETYGTFTLVGRGTGLSSTADGYGGAMQAWSKGDVVVTARIASATLRDNPKAVVGVSIREGTNLTAANVRHVSTLISPTAGAVYARRLTTGGVTIRTIADIAKTQDVWVRIARKGTLITSSTSLDGITWKVLRAETLATPLTTGVNVGLVYSNGVGLGVPSASNWATITDVTVSAQ